jgi:hypothetical protein
MVVCGWALQALKSHPGLWEERYAGSSRTICASASPDLPTPSTLGDVTLRLASTRNACASSGSMKGEKGVFRLHAQPDAKGSWAEVTVAGGEASAVNDAGDALKIESKVDGSTFELTIPYTDRKEQKPWANGLEHHRYSVSASGASPNFYLRRAKEQVQAALLRELGEGLRTWRAVLDEKGYHSTGDGSGWNQFSDTGGYAIS